MFQFWVDFIQKLVKKDDSAQLAAGRLKGSVFMDRLSLSPATLDQIRSDVIRSISRYLVIDESHMTLAVEAEGRTVALAAQIPVVRPRDGAVVGGEGFAVHETHHIVRETPMVETPASHAAAESRPGNPLDPRARGRALRRRRQSRRLGMQP
jgi:cell division topological specificity factor MinE